MSTFNLLTVKEVRNETPHAVSISFEIPDTLKNLYTFIAGQYVTVKHIFNGNEIRRSYSISSSPKSGDFRIVVKAIENGAFSTFATNELKAGDQLEVGTPEGKFVFEPNETKQNNYCGVAAGSGITPIISIAKSVLESESNSSFVLIYGNKTPEETIFYNEIHELQQKYVGRFFVHYSFSQAHPEGSLFGRIERSTMNFVLKNKHSEKEFKAYYLCGPEDMINLVSDILKGNNVNKKNIHFELFTPSTDGGKQIDASGMAKITVLVDDEETTFEMSKKIDILDAALKHGIDAPYSCQGGICSSCMCRIVKGSAEMKKNSILSDEEVAEGLILSCQAIVTSDEIYVDFDDV